MRVSGKFVSVAGRRGHRALCIVDAKAEAAKLEGRSVKIGCLVL